MKLSLKKALFALIIVSIIGAILATYSAIAHFQPSLYEFCSGGQTFDCDVVNQSKYAKLFGIPVAILGLLTYIAFFVIAIISLKKSHRYLLDAMTFFATVGVLFSLYLTYIEAFVLYTWCILCLGSLACILAIGILVFGMRKSYLEALNKK